MAGGVISGCGGEVCKISAVYFEVGSIVVELLLKSRIATANTHNVGDEREGGKQIYRSGMSRTYSLSAIKLSDTRTTPQGLEICYRGSAIVGNDRPEEVPCHTGTPASGKALAMTPFTSTIFHPDQSEVINMDTREDGGCKRFQAFER